MAPNERTADIKNLRELSPGDLFRRADGKYRYVASSNRKGRGCDDSIYCYNIDGESDGYFMRGDESVVRISLPEEKRVPAEAEQEFFFMCYVVGSYPPVVRHADRRIAVAEAERLARISKKRVFVLETVSYVDYSPPSNAVHIWTMLDEEDF